jgi:2-polyprenyl-3-methyl-5-hydroxy-6-metoxy-1,4-benzoquinol methylase/predicted transcriptional regulator
MAKQTQQLSPQLFFDTVNAYQRTEALKAAVELDLFSAIGEGKQTLQELARRCNTSERGMRILCDYLVVMGFLTKQEQHYKLTPESAMFLDRRSPGYMGSAIEFLLSPMLTDHFKDLAANVRKGGTVMPEEGTLAPEHPVWVRFARAMAPMMGLPAQLMAGLVAGDANQKMKVLDLAAGHGLFGISFAQQNANAEIVAVDWPNVLEVASENAQAAGVSGRYRTIAGSAFEVDYGSGYDLVLLTNFLHHFDTVTCEKLLKKVHTALAEGGRAATLEFVPNEDRVSPPTAAAFILMMLGSTPSGDAYTFSELDRMFRNAGFRRNEIHPLPPTFQQVVISYK